MCVRNYKSNIMIPFNIGLGCDESTMKTLTNGESRRMLRGRVYKFKCEEGSVMEGSPDVYCNGNRWNGTKPECLSKLHRICT